MDADVIVVGAGLAGLVATAELADAGQQVLLLDQEPRAVPRRPGVLVASAGCSSSTAPSSGGWASRTPTSSPGRTGWAAPSSTATRTTGRAAGPRRTSTSRPARSARGCTSRGCGSSRRRLGRARRRSRASGHGNSVPRFHLTWGTGPGRGRAVRAPGARGGRRAGWSSFASGTGSTSSSMTGGAVTGVRGAVLAPTTPTAGGRPTATRSATSSSPPRP